MERHLFLEKRIVIFSPTMPIKSVPLSTSRSIASRSYLLIFPATFNLFQLLAMALLILCSMAKGPSRDPIVTNPPTDEDTGNNSGVESIAATTSSPTHGAVVMAKGEIPELSNFFKKTSVTDGERQAYHVRGWLTGNVISSIPEVDVSTVEGSTVICFESHLVAGLGLPASKFLVTIMGYLNYELFHFNPNAISALGTFIMLCECWLGIVLDTSLFWYYYSPVRYFKVVYGGIGLSLRRHYHDEYIPASFKSCWKGSQESWILVDMHKPASWETGSARPGSRRATAWKSSIFSEFAPLAIGRSWHSNVHGCPIPAVNLLRVNPLSSPFVNDKLISN
jgi:hypothetical protein